MVTNWKENKIIQEAMRNAKDIIVDGIRIPPIRGEGCIYDRFSCNCGWTDDSKWGSIIHKLLNLSHKMRKNWDLPIRTTEEKMLLITIRGKIL